jgi:GH25 family lysozyme M1 (1,4-beta-N-acetylmuramidase)
MKHLTIQIILVSLAIAFHSPPVQAAHLEGIDVSRWQNKIDWSAIKRAGIKFAFVKATEDTNAVDSHFAENMKGAATQGILIGTYHFARPDSDRENPKDAANEADHFVKTIEPYYHGPAIVLRPVIDVEKLPGFGKKPQDKAFLSQWVHQFAAVVNERMGFYPIIYTNSNYARNYLEKDVAQYDVWLANWTQDAAKQPPKSQYGVWNKWSFWQYSDRGHIEGIGGRVDRDIFSGTMLELARFSPVFHPGDFDGNGRVDDRDKGVWRKMKGQKVNPGLGADGDLSGTVDDADLAVWNANKGKSYPGDKRRPKARSGS